MLLSKKDRCGSFSNPKRHLLMNSHKTIDGRGASVHTAGGPLWFVAYVFMTAKEEGVDTWGIPLEIIGTKLKPDGDGITIYGSSHVWVDRCSLSNCFDGLKTLFMDLSLLPFPTITWCTMTRSCSWDIVIPLRRKSKGLGEECQANIFSIFERPLTFYLFISYSILNSLHV